VVVFAVARSSDTERHDADKYAGTSDDTLSCCVVRVILFPFFTWLASRVYERIAASSPIRRLESSEGTSPESARSSNSVVADSVSSMRLPLAASAADDTATSMCSSQSMKSVEQAAFEMKRDHTLKMKVAERRRNVVMAVLFAVSTGMSMYNGLKCVRFHYDPKIVGIQGALLGMVMFVINAEYFMLRDYLNKICEEQGELIPHLHLHPVFFETGLKCHSCDVCHERMKGPHYIAYRCRTCDFDLCPRCYKQKDKPNAKGYGSKAIRRDGEQVTTWTYFKRILILALDNWKVTTLALLSLMMNQVLQILSPSLQGSIFDGIIDCLKDPAGNGRNAFHTAMIIYIIVNALQALFGGLKALGQELVMRQLACSVRTKLFTSIIRMDITFFDAMHTGQLTSRLTNDASQMVQPLSTLMNDMVANLMNLVGGMLMAFRTSWKLSILALTVVPPITFCYRLYASWGRKVNRSIYAAYGEANSVATEAIANIRTVRGFSTEAHETGKYDFAVDTALQHGKKNAYVAGSVSAFSTYMNLGTAVLILWYGGTQVCDSNGQELSLGKLFTFQLYWNMMNTAFISLGNVFNDLIRSSSAAERVFSLIDARPEMDPDAGDTVSRDSIKGHLALRGVEFRYRTRPDNLVLKGVNLEMPPGTTTALVGKSGGGKSTIVHLLMRFYEPTDGAIFLDGRNTTELSSRSLRTLCGFVAQETQLFATSIEENLAYGLGRPHTREEVIAACEAANAHEFIMDTEEQYDTRVGEKGVMLSGGQRQRLAIARCFLRQPRLLFLDEATSALDAENEALVQQALDKLIESSGCTVVLIAHRLSTVINSNQIAVVHKGKIVERGDHESLCNKGGVYAQLVKRQMSRDASSVMEQKKAMADKKGAGPKSVQTEIDELIEEMEASGGLNLTEDVGPELGS